MNLQQPIRWQHLALFLAAVGLLSGAMMFSVARIGNAPKAAPWWVGAIVFAASALVGVVVLASLKRDQRRAAFVRLANAGLFRLPDDASEPIAQFNAHLIEHFGVTPHEAPLPESSTLSYQTPGNDLPREPLPRTFGELVDAVYADVARGTWITPAQHAAAREALAAVLNRPADSIRFGDALDDVIPSGRRRFAVWQALHARAPNLPDATLNPWLENVAIYGFLAALIAIAVPIAQRLDANPATHIEHVSRSTRAFGHLAGLVLFGVIIAVLMVPVHVVGRRYACRLPDNVRRVGSLGGFFPAPPDATPWARDEIASHLRDLLAGAMHRSPQAFTDGAPLIPS